MKIGKSSLLVGLSLLALVFLGAALVKWRGFRASSPPGPFETSVARSIRDFAIPRTEHRRTNPVAGEPAALAQGQEAFLARCAVCHGVDGRGGTPIGANQYPRVPDLRSDPTQRLSDGDIRYIIENGVQLSGMPAMRGAHSETEAETWKLVTYVRSFRSVTPEEAAAQLQIASSAHYVGSEACQKCHAAIYARWKKTPMANVVRDPDSTRTRSFPISRRTMLRSSPSIK
jgi:mono/diheme cytochrome c family protein